MEKVEGLDKLGGILKKLTSVTTEMSNINSNLNRFLYEKDMEDVVKPGLTHIKKQAIKHLRKRLYECTTPYSESADEITNEMAKFDDLYNKAIKLEISEEDSKYLNELFKLYSLALYRIAVLGGV